VIDSPTQTVVVIDDEDEIRALMELALARPGRTVVGFADGNAALAYLSAGRPVDVVVSDVRMAGLDGYSLVQRLQERTATAGTPVIFVSANDAVDDRLAPVGSDVEYVRKPFDIADLRARVDASIARRAAPVLGFHELLARAIARASEAGDSVSVILVATVPEQRSPGVASTIAGIVRGCLRRSDTAAMLPPYACAALLAGCPADRARDIASSVAAGLEAGRTSLRCDAHVGLAFARDCSALDAGRMLEFAATAVGAAASAPQRFAMRETSV